jgi:hypothetical protein
MLPTVADLWITVKQLSSTADSRKEANGICTLFIV